MTEKISRRQFAQTATVLFGLGAVANSTGIEPFKRAGRERLRLGLAAYSFRQYFQEASHNRENAAPAAKQIDLFQFVDYCAEQGCDGAELTSYYFPKELSNEFLLQVKRHAFLRGMDLSGTAVGNTFTHPAGEKREKQITHVKEWIDHAAVLGIPHIRVFAGNTEGQSLDQAKKNCISALEECCDYASDRGVFLGIENHGGIVAEADGLLEIIRAVDSPWLGVNLDTGNFHTADPYGDIQRCAPYAVNVQVKTEIRARGKAKEEADLGRLINILRDVDYQGYVVLEYEAAEDPYRAVPGILEKLRALI